MLIEAPKVKKTFLKKVQDIVGSEWVSTTNLDRLNYARDSWFRATIQYTYNKVEHFPDIICWPASTAEVQKLVKVALKEKMPIVPYGAGSGVCGGTVPVKGGMIIDVKRMRAIVDLDKENLLATIEPGIMGKTLEDELQRQGYTLGHFPSSILCASFGGYLAARSAGQLSSRYGKIEDMVTEMEVVTGKGEVVSTRHVANTDGLDLNQIFVGSEGTLGLITKGTVRVYPLPAQQKFRGFKFKNMKTAIEAMRRMMQTGIKPSVVRLYDELDTVMFLSAVKKHGGSGAPSAKDDFVKKLKHFAKFKTLKTALVLPRSIQLATKLMSGCLLILVHEGAPHLVREEEKIVAEICKDLRADDLGEDPGRHWYANRYSISYNASHLFDAGTFTDTIEVATTWDNLYCLYQGMIKAIQNHAMIMAHLSHVYPDGGSLYFTFVAPLKGLKGSTKLYDKIWDKALTACHELGGTISHHHGIGRLKRKFMVDEWGTGVHVYRALKEFYDPQGIMNPGKLVPLERDKRKKEVA